MDEELLRCMTATGCTAIGYGLESGSDSVLKILHKGFSIKEATHTIVQSMSHFKTIKLFLMWGFPFETLIEFKETMFLVFYISQAAEGKCSMILAFNHLMPMPNSPLYAEYKDSILFDEAAAKVRFVCRGDGSMMALNNGSAEMLQLIKDHPKVFAPYWRFEDSNFLAKWNLLLENNDAITTVGL